MSTTSNLMNILISWSLVVPLVLPSVRCFCNQVHISPKSGINKNKFSLPAENNARVSILTEITDEPGSLHELLRYFWKYEIDLTHIESRYFVTSFFAALYLKCA